MGPPGEKLRKTFQLDPGGCVFNFLPVLTVSSEKFEDLRKSCALPLEVPLKALPLTFRGTFSISAAWLHISLTF